MGDFWGDLGRNIEEWWNPTKKPISFTPRITPHGTALGTNPNRPSQSMRRSSDSSGPVNRVSEAPYPVPKSQIMPREQVEPENDLMGQLMERISATYQPMMPPAGGGASAANNDIMARLNQQLDEALAARLGAIGNVRNQAQQGYNTSDSNLAAMFGANANHIATQGSQRFGEIAQNHQAGINQQREASVGQLKGDRDEAMARRTEMLNRLGIQAAGEQADPNEETLNNAITATTNRADKALQGSQQANATNQAFNQSVVNSVNQQGTERRAALLQQLQSIQNQLGMAEAEAQGQNAQAKSQLEMQRMQAEAEAQSQSVADYNKFGYQQFRDNRDLAFDLYKTMLGQQGKDQSTKVQGFAGLGQDLINQGIPEQQVSGYMAALSSVLGSEYMKGIHPDEGYDRASIISRRLQEMNVPGPIAAHLATNYANLGNNAYYNAQPAQ